MGLKLGQSLDGHSFNFCSIFTPVHHVCKRNFESKVFGMCLCLSCSIGSLFCLQEIAISASILPLCQQYQLRLLSQIPGVFIVLDFQLSQEMFPLLIPIFSLSTLCLHPSPHEPLCTPSLSPSHTQCLPSIHPLCVFCLHFSMKFKHLPLDNSCYLASLVCVLQPAYSVIYGYLLISE